MNFIKKFVVYLLLLVFDVKTVVNDTENLDKCLQRIDETLTQSKESHRNLLKLIDQSTVILKAFCSENLIKSVEECDDIDDDDDAGLSENNGMLNDDDYNDYYFYKSDDERNLKILMTFTPTTVYKGTNLLRQLESFNNQEYYRIKGQLNATLALGKSDKILFQRKCFGNSAVNNESQIINENHLIERQIRQIVPGQLIIFAKLDRANRLTIKTNGIMLWKPTIEHFLWNNLGWSGWSKWSHCSSECNGIQQRYRRCLTNRLATVGNEGGKSESAIQQSNQQSCNGYNVEQRGCNLYDCKDAVNILSQLHNKTSSNGLSTNINLAVDREEFTIMLTLRIKVSKHSPHFNQIDNQHLLIFSSDEYTSTPFTLTISFIENGIKVVQEKESTSEMFTIKLNLFDLHWHQIAISFRRDGLITCFFDCNWDSSIILSRNSFELPASPRVELNRKLSDLVEWKQLVLVDGTRESSQCSSDRTPIFDNNKLLDRMFNDEMMN